MLFISFYIFKISFQKATDPLLSNIGLISNTNNASFVDTDVNPSMGMISIQRFDNSAYTWPIFKYRSLELRLPSNVFFDENNISIHHPDQGSADNIQVDDYVLSFEFNNLTINWVGPFRHILSKLSIT